MPFKQSQWISWPERSARKLPSIQKRVQTVGKRFYSGCGFHYAMEERVAAVAKYLALYSSDDFPGQIITRVMFSGLCQDVAKAERSADHIAKHGLGGDK